MQERDIKILQLISDTRLCTTEQIQNILFQGVVPRVCYRRLQSLIDSNLIKRKYYRVYNKNVYVYFLDKPPAKRNLEHDLLITEFYVQLVKNDFEILEFERSPIIAGIVPDAIVKFKRPNTQEIKSVFLEVQLSPHDCMSKYYNIKSKTEKDIPGTLYIVTNQEIKNAELRDLKVVIDTTEFKKLGFYFS